VIRQIHQSFFPPKFFTVQYNKDLEKLTLLLDPKLAMRKMLMRVVYLKEKGILYFMFYMRLSKTQSME